MLGDLLTEHHGRIDVATTISHINPIVQTGNLHVAIYEVAQKKIYLAHSAGSSEAGTGAPLLAFERPYMAIDAAQLLEEARPSREASREAAPPQPCESGFDIRGECVPPGVSPLDWYVNHVVDDKYGWTGPVQTFGVDGGGTAYVLNLTSQGWLANSDFKETSLAKDVWTHQLIVVVPAKIVRAEGWLWITGGDNDDTGPVSPVAADDGEVATAAALSAATGSVCSVLKQVPNQPVQFRVDLPHPDNMYPDEERTEDGIIAYTWNHLAVQDPTRPEWAARLPMTKSASKAMDAIGEFVSKLRPEAPKVDKFVVGGASKRGWTTWTTGLVDERCIALVPVVMDFLAVRNNTVNAFESLGGYTFEFADYIAAGLLDSSLMYTEGYTKLMNLVDPHQYFRADRPAWDETPALRNFRAIPKLVVDGCNDEFMLPDDNHAWWDDLEGEKHLLHIANADHPLAWWPPGSGNGPAVFEASLLAFYSAVVFSKKRPTFTWQLSEDGLIITAGNFSERPTALTQWESTTSNGQRDWRLFDCRTGPGNNCTHFEANPAPDAPPGCQDRSPLPSPPLYLPSIVLPSSSAALGSLARIPFLMK